MEHYIVRRSAMRMWLLALAGVPFIIISVDVLFQRSLTDALRQVVFPPDDTQLFEARDVIWAWVMLALGLVMTGWGLKELISPPAVLSASAFGLALRLRAPFRPPVIIRWEEIEGIRTERLGDEGDVVEALVLDVSLPHALPEHPWGARWMRPGSLAVATDDWEQPGDEVASKLKEMLTRPGPWPGHHAP